MSERRSARVSRGLLQPRLGHPHWQARELRVPRDRDGRFSTELFARYAKVRLNGVIQTQAVLVAIGVNWDGRRQVRGVELSNRESRSR